MSQVISRSLFIVGIILMLAFTLFGGHSYYSATRPSIDDLDFDENFKESMKTVARELRELQNDHSKLKNRWEAYKSLEWVFNIGVYDYYHEFSQTHTDSILQFIFQNLGTTNKYYVEFGTEDGSQTNTRWLREKLGWKGLLMDGGHDNPSINLHKEMMKGSNIVQLFQKYDVPKEFDLLSVDLDYNTYWVWKAIDHHLFRPRVLVVEYQADWSNSWESDPLGVKNCEECMWIAPSGYFGANSQALAKLGRDKGYTLVYMESQRVNIYFVRTDLLGGQNMVDEFIPFKRIFRWGQLRIHPETTVAPMKLNGLD
ncbi:hypothetical protein HK096_005564 [Nowakowskiella sp. JEL0078]|nr:hypothetical protein HK096_005564 [Nowakowskiella sp. JEL0078]